jgi:hypothetical protein
MSHFFLMSSDQPPHFPAEGVHPIIGLRCSEMEEQCADGVGLGVEEEVEVRLRHAFDVVHDLDAGEGQHGSQGADFGRESGHGSNARRAVVLRGRRLGEQCDA